MIYLAWPAIAQTAPPSISGNCNNYGNNNFNCNTLNVAPPRALFSEEIGNQMLTHMPDKGKSIWLTTVGNAPDQKIGETVYTFLRNHGYNNVKRDIVVGGLAPAPDHPFSFEDTPGQYTIIVSPEAH